MNKNEANRLVQYIENAIDWLLKAKGEYNQDNQIRAELNLNLAQAEVKHAWELSRQQSVLVNEKKIKDQPQKIVWMLPIAACITLFLSLGMVFWAKPFFLKYLNNKEVPLVKTEVLSKNALPAKNELNANLESTPIMVAEKITQSEKLTDSDKLIKKDLSEKPVKSNRDRGTNSIRKSSKLTENPSQNSPQATSNQVALAAQPAKVAEEKVAEENEKTSARHVENPASLTVNLAESATELKEKMSFNEDDLTKIATYSLFNGQ